MKTDSQIQEAVLEQQDVSDILHQFCLFLMRLYYKGQFQIITLLCNYLFAICKNCTESLEKHYMCFNQMFSNRIVYMDFKKE